MYEKKWEMQWNIDCVMKWNGMECMWLRNVNEYKWVWYECVWNMKWEMLCEMTI